MKSRPGRGGGGDAGLGGDDGDSGDGSGDGGASGGGGDDGGRGRGGDGTPRGDVVVLGAQFERCTYVALLQIMEAPASTICSKVTGDAPAS